MLRFNRLELAGSLGDLGTLLPIAMAMILINGLSATGVLCSVGLFYILSGLYFRVTVPVQPMKVIGAYAIATAMTPQQITASGLVMGLLLLVVGLTGIIDVIRRLTPKPVIRGVQLSTGALLIAGGIKFMIGTSSFQSLQQAVEPHLIVQRLGPIPISILIGALAGLLTLSLLDNKRFPGGLVVIGAGLCLGLLLGTHAGLDAINPGVHLPSWLPFGWPDRADLTFALLVLVLPQIPMTLGNAVMAYSELSREYFGEDSARVTNRAVCLSMGLANIGSFLLGGMPLCHGAGGLAAHYRFGARTAGSNLMIGGVFLLLALLLGKQVVAVLNLLPLSILGVLLVFAGTQLTLTIIDLKAPKDLFVATLILGITLAANLAVGFIVGIAAAWALKWERLSI